MPALIAPHWPPPWGVDAGPLQQLIIDDEFAKRPGLVRPSLGIAEWILPSVLRAAPKDLQDKLIPPTQRGEIRVVPAVQRAGRRIGSRRAGHPGHQGRRRLDASTGTRSGRRRRIGRTSGRCWRAPIPTAGKHRGIGYFILDMRSPGIEVQPIKTATGDAHFNEVFLTDVFVPDDMLLGDPTGGWNLAIATMAEERSAISGYVKFDRAAALRRLAAATGPGPRRRAARPRRTRRLHQRHQGAGGAGNHPVARRPGVRPGVQHRQGGDERAAAANIRGHAAVDRAAGDGRRLRPRHRGALSASPRPN